MNSALFIHLLFHLPFFRYWYVHWVRWPHSWVQAKNMTNIPMLSRILNIYTLSSSSITHAIGLKLKIQLSTYSSELSANKCFISRFWQCRCGSSFTTAFMADRITYMAWSTVLQYHNIKILSIFKIFPPDCDTVHWWCMIHPIQQLGDIPTSSQRILTCSCRHPTFFSKICNFNPIN